MLLKSLFISLSIIANAFALRPEWIEHTPSAYHNANYFYRVATATDRTYEKARAKAFDDAVEKSAQAIGVAKEIIRDSSSSEITVKGNVLTALPINVVCEYEEKLITKNEKRVYILVQVARNGASGIPKYRAFDCERNNESEEK